jgi:hypothetical protein
VGAFVFPVTRLAALDRDFGRNLVIPRSSIFYIENERGQSVDYKTARILKIHQGVQNICWFQLCAICDNGHQFTILYMYNVYK